MATQKRMPLKRVGLFVLLGTILGSMIKDQYSPRVFFDKNLVNPFKKSI